MLLLRCVRLEELRLWWLPVELLLVFGMMVNKLLLLELLMHQMLGLRGMTLVTILRSVVLFLFLARESLSLPRRQGAPVTHHDIAVDIGRKGRTIASG